MYATQLSDGKGCSQDLPLPKLHLRVGSGCKGILFGDLCLLDDLTGLQKVSGFFLLFLHPCLSGFLLTATWDLAALLPC